MKIRATKQSPVYVPWPKRPDGSNKTMGEMTQEERRAQWKSAAVRMQANDPGRHRKWWHADPREDQEEGE